jgi:DNA-binding winged helix-turn-helix (wHTH) protein
MPVAFGDFVFDPQLLELRKDGVPLKVEAQLLNLLACFLAHPDRVLSKKDLIDQVWDGRVIADSGLTVAVSRLKKLIGKSPSGHEYIENRYGRGYRFVGVHLSQMPALARAHTEKAQNTPPAPRDAPLVGRLQAMQRLEAALTRANACKGNVCVLIGEPGIGKTRLSEELEQRARALGMATAWGRFQSRSGTPPLWPFAQLLRELNSDGAADEVLRLLEKQSVEPAAGSSDPAALGAGTCSFGDVAESHRTVDRVAQVLCGLSQRRTLLLLLDDVQWADAASLRLMSYLVADLTRWPIAIVATVRSTEVGTETRRSGDLAQLIAHRNVERIELPRLDQGEVTNYVSALFGPESAELADAVYQQSEGNPFFMVELLRPWAAGRRPDPRRLHVSGFALDLIRQRVRGLADSTRTALSAAAIIGHDFDLGLLSYVMDRSAEELLQELDESLANHTLHASAEIHGAYTFDHELIREVLVNDLPANERCRLHLRVGDGLARRRSAGANVPSAELAHHFLSALPQGDISVAILHTRQAAQAAMRLASHADARTLLRRALEALRISVEPDPQTMTSLLLELAMAERGLGDSIYTEHLAQGVRLAREQRLGPLLAAAGQLLSPTPGVLALGDAHDVLQAAADVIPATDPRRRAMVLSHLAWTPPTCLSARRVRELLAEAEPLANASGETDARATVRAAKLYFSAGPATMSVAEALVDEIENEERAHPETARAGRSLRAQTLRLMLAMQRGDAASVARQLHVRASILEKMKNLELSWHHDRITLLQRMNRGEFARVEADLQELRERAKRARLQAWQTLWRRDYGALMYWTGDPGVYSAYGAHVRASLIPTDADLPAVRSRRIRTMVEFDLLDDARTALQQISIEALFDLPGDRDFLCTLADLALVSAETDTRDYCKAIYQLLEPYPDLYSAGIAYHCDGSISWYLGKLARALGRDAAARDHFEHAIDRHTAFEQRAWAAQTRVDLGALLRDSAIVRDCARATRLFSEARVASEQLGLRRLLHVLDAASSHTELQRTVAKPLSK